ncbi:MAG: hypothetical protein IIA30_09385, partial [Myxococcales bacterium]|nr:hypothetical protein [Myxococcales bacterium]
MMIGIAIVGLLAAIAVPQYTGYHEKAQRTETIAAFRAIEGRIESYRSEFGELPETLAAAIEQNHDEKGINFPLLIAPYQVHLVGLNLSDETVAAAADRLYAQLWAEGIETLYDDRTDQAAGVKLNDADLIGLPVRLVVSPRNLKNNVVELKGRKDSEA